MELHFEQSGDKAAQTIVFIHGGGMDGSVWRNNINYFGDYNCIVIDLPEHGMSADIKPFSIEKSVELIATIIRNNSNTGNAHVIGHSLGGVILINLISMYPELIDHAVVASGNLRPSAIYKIFTNSLICKSLSTLNEMKYKKKYVTPELLKRIYTEMIEYSKIPSNLDGTKIPTFFIAGENEPGFLKKSNQDLINIFENSKGITISKAKHNYPWGEYRIFNKLVRAWINDELINDESILMD